ncbi:hypothetical protein [Paenibacillus baekrokdamisoli]|uniref:hypothetical protein n=1 Tax=Paenibacillus baekrokdamisoli TaxID=1712516 RepID=UPI0013E0AE62|nr:hypothetical protein [Paenibacillus baekrokdamisoli]
MLANEVMIVMGWILAGVIIGGALLYLLRSRSRILQIIIDGLAVLAYLGFFMETASSVLRTLMDGTVFMTQVHEVLLNSIFLISGGYLGPYGLCFLLGLVRKS